MWSEHADPSVQRVESYVVQYANSETALFCRPFVVRTNASDKGIGAVLLQSVTDNNFLKRNANKKLNHTQAAYAIVERECLAVIWDLEKFTTYIYGRTFVIQTDHQPLALPTTTPLTNPKIIR